MATVMVTGASAGIGRAAALQLGAAGHRVVLGVRDRARGEAVAAAIAQATPGARADVVVVDMAEQASIRAAVAAIDDAGIEIDVVIHNAAAFDISQQTPRRTGDGVESVWATNTLGPMLLTALLLPGLRARRGRVIAVTSKGLMMQPLLKVDVDDHDFQRRRFSVPKAYYQSKLAHLAWMLDLAEREPLLRVHGVRVTNVRVDMDRYPDVHWLLQKMYAVKSRFSITPEQMAETYTWLATTDDVAVAGATGGYWDAVGVKATPSSWARVTDHRAAVLALCRRQLGLEAGGGERVT